MKSVAIIDGDGILFSRAVLSEAKVGPDEYFPLVGVDEAYIQVAHEIEALRDMAGCDSALVCLSDSSSNCFRRKIYPSYKSNRKDAQRPALLEELRQMVLNSDDGYGKLAIKTLEADDVCGISSGILQEQGRRAVIVSPDKDLATIPGKLLATKPGYSGKRLPVIDITEEEADKAFLRQTLIGDTADGYPGCRGVGPKKADKYLHNTYGLKAMWEAVVECFKAHDQTEEEALVQARTARILRSCDWDAKRKKVILWEPPRD